MDARHYKMQNISQYQTFGSFYASSSMQHVMFTYRRHQRNAPLVLFPSWSAFMLQHNSLHHTTLPPLITHIKCACRRCRANASHMEYIYKYRYRVFCRDSEKAQIGDVIRKELILKKMVSCKS